MVDLIVTLCLLANPGSCRDKHLLFQSSGSLNACMREAQPYLATWIQGYPKLRIRSYRCAWPESEKTDL